MLVSDSAFFPAAKAALLRAASARGYTGVVAVQKALVATPEQQQSQRHKGARHASWASQLGAAPIQGRARHLMQRRSSQQSRQTQVQLSAVGVPRVSSASLFTHSEISPRPPPPSPWGPAPGTPAELQLERRRALARLRNALIAFGLRLQDYAFWVDADISDMPAGTLRELVASGRDVVTTVTKRCHGALGALQRVEWVPSSLTTKGADGEGGVLLAHACAPSRA